MSRYRMNYGITAADDALLFELVEVTNRAGRPLSQWLSISPSQDMSDAMRLGEFAEVRRRLNQTLRERHEQPAIAAFIHEKKLHDPQRAGLHGHALGSWDRGMSETILRSLTGVAVDRIGRGTWLSDNKRINVHVTPNSGPDGIIRRAGYGLKQRCEEFESEVIAAGLIDNYRVWKLEAPAPIRIDRLILSPEAWDLIHRDRDSRAKVYFPPAPIKRMPLAPPAPEEISSLPKLQIVVSNPVSVDPFQPSLFADENRTPRLADFGGGIMPAEVAREIEKRRREMGLTQQQLADACKIARPTLANAMQGRFALSVWATARLREFLLSPPPASRAA